MILIAGQTDEAIVALSGGDPDISPLLLQGWVHNGIATGEFWTATEGDELLGFFLWVPPKAGADVP